jgi:DNA helicase IV
LRAIEEVPRAAVFGGAGTGKTVLAVEDARKHAEAGMRTLFTCYNRALAANIRRRVANGPSINVMNFHELCASSAKKVGISTPQGVSEARLFDEIYPELLMQAIEAFKIEQYDAIIVDEGQDFLPLWWSALDACLDPSGKQHLRIFYDNNQRVYGSTGRLPVDVALVPIRLTLNLRNTRRIHELVRQHYEGHSIEAIGPEGVRVNWITAEGLGSIRRRIAETVTRLVLKEGVPAENIAVLVSTEKEIGIFAPKDRIGGIHASRCDAFREGSVIVDSIRRFKGLESSVVIVAVTQEIVHNKELPYVSMSRARTHLVLAGPKMVLRNLRNSSSTCSG